MENDDEGFLGYIPATVDPGPILLVATVAIGCFLLIILPIAVIIGDKYEELEKRSGDNATDEDAEDQDENEIESSKVGRLRREARAQNVEMELVGDDDASVESRGTIYSALSGALKEMLEQKNGRIKKTRGRKHRRLRNDAAFQHVIHHQHDDDQHGDANGDDQDGKHDGDLGNMIAICGSFVDVSIHDKDNNDRHPAQNGMRDDDTRASESLERSVVGESLLSDCGASQYGKESKIVAVTGHTDFMDDDYNRNVCLTVDGFLDEIASIMAWDFEMKRIIKLSIPFATQAIFTGALDTLTVGVIGKLIGTREVSAFVIVNLLLELTYEFVGGLIDALTTLCSQAIGHGKYRLAGKYVQIATILYTVAYIPFAVMWVFYLDPAIEWFGFDDETVRIGKQYGMILLVDYLMDGLGEAIHALLDVAGFENYSTFIGATEELLAFLVIVLWATLGNPTLLTVGYVQFGMGCLFLLINICIICWKGWFRPYRAGMVGSFALADKKAVWMVCKTATSLSFGYLLTDGEWELLTIFASFLGPAEVAAWGIFGTIWDAVNELIDGIADASEVRCAYLLGSGEPRKARLSAYKSLMICVFSSLFVTSALYMAGNSLPTWLTNDPTLQHLLRDLMPLFGLANATMSLGTMSWTLLGASGRYRLATVVVFVVSWLVTLPLGAVLSIYLKLDLRGQTSAVIVGYMISGAVHAYFLFRSDWMALSKEVMDDNASRISDESSKGEDAAIPVPLPAAQSDLKGADAPPVRRSLPRRPSGQAGEPIHTVATGITGQWKDRTDDIELTMKAD